MPVRKQDVADALAIYEAEPLFAVLDAAGISARGAESPRELAERTADALWWNYCTPFGYVADRVTLDEIVAHVARRLDVAEASDAGDAWETLAALTRALGDRVGPVSLHDLDPKIRARLETAWFPTAAGAGGATAALGARELGRAIVWLGRTPVGRLLPLIPTVGPIWRGVRGTGAVAAAVGGPLAVALAVVSLNQALGTNYQRLVPLLLGVGALGPRAVSDAQTLEGA